MVILLKKKKPIYKRVQPIPVVSYNEHKRVFDVVHLNQLKELHCP